MVTPKDVQCPIIKTSVVDIIEEVLRVQGRRATHGGKIGHGFMPPIVIYIHQRLIVEYPITGHVVMEILSVVGALAQHH